MTELLQQPQTQGWLLLIAVVCLAVLAVGALLGLGVLLVVAREFRQRATFSEKLQPLLDQGKLDSVVQQSRERLMTFPDDAMAHYFLGVALQRKGELRQALVHLRRVPELQAGWDVAPMILAIEQKLQVSDGGSELRVVKLPTESSQAPGTRSDA